MTDVGDGGEGGNLASLAGSGEEDDDVDAREETT